ncbi:tetratricopeptide repeat protein [Streptomyces sp. NPDC098077]|uniref:tetratricopeptide repeat protein n=1 Tax=Streptomyces sp. NPDC098077 TaxID=3366093 RepID=UPI0037FF5C6B
MSGTTPGGFGLLLRELRLHAGLSQEQLAHRAGVSVRAVTDMERGHTRGPQRRTIQSLAGALELEAAQARQLEEAAATGRGRPHPSGAQVLSRALSLPRAPRDFTARAQALAALGALADSADPADPPVAVICGTPGLGKTALAVRAAQLLAPLFPSGQLYLDLQGMDPEPVVPRDALARLLAALGIAAQAMPHTVEERSGLFRAVAAKHRLLLVLDNAADEAQIRPLLPTAGSGLTIVTSRNRLSGLESVHRIALPLMRREEALTFLTRILGPERIGAEEQAARDLADRCGRLPLALRIAGQRLAARPEERLNKLASLLEREERRLDVLQTGDLQVRAAFTLSYQQLGPTAQRLLRRCALAAGPDVSPETAALLTGIAHRDAALLLEGLCDRGLLQPHPAAERHRFHDLVRIFAGEQLAAEDTAETQQAFLDRTMAWMLARATACALHFDAERHDTSAIDPDPATAPASRDQARAWLEAEREQWLAALHRARATGRHRLVVDTAAAMHWFSDLTQHWAQWVDVFQYAADSARDLGSRREEATHLNYLAWAHSTCAHRPAAALEAADAALISARACGDLLQTGWALGYGAGALRRLGRTDEAISRLRASLACHRDNQTIQGRLAEMSTLNTLGETLCHNGRAEEALIHHLNVLDICRVDHPGLSPELLAVYQAIALSHLGNAYAALDRWQEAELPLRRALAGFEQAGSPARSGPVQLALGRVLRHLNRTEEAHTALTTALHTLTTHHHPLQTEASAQLTALEHTPTGEPAPR